jgi:hypothetical protein
MKSMETIEFLFRTILLFERVTIGPKSLVGPDSLGAGDTASEDVLDALVLSIRNTGSAVLDLEAAFARVDFARSVFAADVFDTWDKCTVGSLSFGGATTARVEGGEEVEAFRLGRESGVDQACRVAGSAG